MRYIQNSIKILLLISFWTNNAFSQKVGINSSFFIAAIGSNGIMIASESRGSIYDQTDSSHSILAYCDEEQKTAIMGADGFAETGNGLYGGVFFKGVIHRFAMVSLKPPPLSHLFANLLYFCQQDMPVSVYNLFASNLMVAAGYENGKPTICYYNGILKNKGCINTTGYFESDTTIFKDLYSDTISCENLGKIAIKAIYKYAKDNNKQSIGGPVRILKIDSSGTYWIENKPIFNWNYFSDFLSDYNKHKVKLQYTSKKNIKKVKELFENMQR